MVSNLPHLVSKSFDKKRKHETHTNKTISNDEGETGLNGKNEQKKQSKTHITNNPTKARQAQRKATFRSNQMGV